MNNGNINKIFIENKGNENKKMNNIKIIKNEKDEESINNNKRNNILNNIYQNISRNSKKNKEKKEIIPLSDKRNNKTNENQFNKKISNDSSSLRDKILFDFNNLKVELPSLNKNINKSPKINNIFEKNKFINNNVNETPSTIDFTNSTKKNIISQNITEQLGKYRIGLSSANSLSNNNPIIPIIPFNRPISNFNVGGNQLWKIDNNNINQNNIEKSNININNTISPIKSLYQKENMNNLMKNTIKKRKIVKSMDLKKKSLNSLKFNYELSNNINNMGLKLHKIKIEKGMMNKNSFGDNNKIQIIDNKIISAKNNKKIFFI